MAPPLSSPYVGLRPFERDDCSRFYGRDYETLDLSSLILANRWVLLYAASGSGKTSLLNAGVTTALVDEYQLRVLPVGRLRVIGEPLGRKTQATNIFVRNMLMNWSSNASPGTLALRSDVEALQGAGSETERYRARSEPASSSIDSQLDLSDYLAQEAVAAGSASRVLMIDQFEELFVLHPERQEDRRGFMTELANAMRADEDLRVVLALREDYLASFERIAPALDISPSTRYRLDLLDNDAALHAVKKPVEEQTTRRFARGAAEMLVDDLLSSSVDAGEGRKIRIKGEGVEPVQLQLMCRRLWDALPPEHSEITVDDVEGFGSVDDVLQHAYDEAIAAIANKLGRDERWLRVWIETHFITTLGTRNSVYETPLETDGLPNDALDLLGEHQIARSEWRSQTKWWELTHDRLIGAIQAANRAAFGARTFTSDDPKIAEATSLLERASAAQLAGDGAAAKDAARKANELFRDGDYSVGIAQSLYALGHAQASLGEIEAVETLSEAARLLEQIDSSAAQQARLEAAVTAANLGDLPRSEGLARAALSAADEDEDRGGAASAAYVLGQVAYFLGDFVSAQTAYLQAAELARALGNQFLEAQVLVEAARVEATTGDRAAALRLVSEAIDADETSADAHELRASLEWELGELEQAITDLSRALDLNDQFIEARAERGQVLAEAGRYEEALSDLDAAIALLPPDSRLLAYARRSRGEVYAASGDIRRGIEEVTASIKMQPGNPWAYLTRAQIKAKAGDTKGAQADLRKALTLQDPPLPERLLKEATAMQRRLGEPVKR